MKQKIKLYYGFCLTSLGLCLVRMCGGPLASRGEGHWVNIKKHLGDTKCISMGIANVNCFSHFIESLFELWPVFWRELVWGFF